jgi:hypothetical protein
MRGRVRAGTEVHVHADHKDIAFVDHAIFQKSGSVVVVVVCADVVRFRGIRVAEAAEEVLTDAVAADAVPAAAGPCSNWFY